MRRLYLLLTAALLAVCVPADPRLPAARMWLVADPGELLASAGALPLPAMPAPDRAVLAEWQNPPTRWLALAREAVAREFLAPTRAARSYALLAAGMNDALLLAERARGAGSEVSDDAALAELAARVLSYSHPALAETFAQRAASARWAGAWRGRDTPAAVAAGAWLGAATAERVIGWAQRDGADSFVAFDDPAAAPGVWQRTPPHLAAALDPGWGNVRPIGLASLAGLGAPAPPAWDSPAFRADRAAFLAAQRDLSSADRSLAWRWAAPAGSATPAGLWLQTAEQLVARDQLGPRESAAVFAALAVAMHDALIACWQSKYRYVLERPISWMRASDPSWQSLIETPPFPSYPSGHATLSGAAAAALAVYFPHDAARLAGDAEAAARSRVLGGIHWPLDGRAGLAQGRQVTAALLQPAERAD